MKSKLNKRNNFDDYLYCCDCSHDFLFKRLENKYYQFNEDTYKFDEDYTINKYILGKEIINANSDLEAFYYLIEEKYQSVISNLKFFRERLYTSEKTMLYLESRKYIYEREHELKINSFLDVFEYFGVLIRIFYYNDILYFHYSSVDENKIKNPPDSVIIIKCYKDKLLDEIKKHNQTIEKARTELKEVSTKRDKFKKLYPEFYM